MRVRPVSAARTRLLTACMEGYSSGPGASPYITTSPNDYAWRVGRYMAKHGITAPVACWAGRGDRVNVHTAANEYVATVRIGANTVQMDRVFS